MLTLLYYYGIKAPTIELFILITKSELTTNELKCQLNETNAINYYLCKSKEMRYYSQLDKFVKLKYYSLKKL